MIGPHDKPVSDWQLERFLLGELDPESQAALRTRVAREPELARRLRALEESSAEILRRYEPAAMATELRGRLHVAEVQAAQPRRLARRRVLAFALPSAAAIAIVAVVAIGPRPQPPGLATDAGDGITIEGGPQLAVFRARGDERVLMRNGDRAARGDLLQLAYRAPGATYGAILSIDGRGSVTWHFPKAERAALLATGDLTPLADAYELDDAPTCERFFLVTGDNPFALAPVMDAAERFARDLGALADPRRALSLPAGLEQTSFIVRKEGSQ